MNTNHTSIFIIIFILTLTLTLIFPPISTQSNFPNQQSYNQHCSHLIQPSPTSNSPQQFTSNTPKIISSFASESAFQILGQITPTNTTLGATFIPTAFQPTLRESVYKLGSSLTIQTRHKRGSNRRHLFNVRGGPMIPIRDRVVRFYLNGFWDSGSGQMCLVGNGRKYINGMNVDFNAVFKAIYRNSSTVNSSLVFGFLESLDSDNSDAFFKTVSIMGLNMMNYKYTLINDHRESSGKDTNSSFSYEGRMFRNCQQISSLASYFQLSYPKQCGGRTCTSIDGVLGFLPRFMSMNEIDCTGNKMVRVAFVVSNVSDVRNNARQQPLNPNRTLVAEGAWNEEKTEIDFVVCRILNFTENPLNASIGDCSIRVNFALPDTLTLRNWSVISGHIWSKKGVNESGYFDRIEIRSSGTRRAALPDMKYKYTEIESARKFCDEKKGNKRKGKNLNFPDPFSQDLKFDMDVKNSKNDKSAFGKAHPVFVGARFVQNMYPYFRTSVLPTPTPTPSNSIYMNNTSPNVAYRIIVTPKDEFSVGVSSYSGDEKIIISAEGIYDAEIGRLCMVGCWNRGIDGNFTMDCDIFVNIQFPSRGEDSVVKGTIESKRDKNSDNLYFEHLDLSGTSLTKYQVKEVFWRMDFEITLVLISKTLACVVIGLQLFHVKKHPNVLPFVSIVMLVVVTFGHMIPLLLNMEAFFLSNHTKKTVLFESGGWLEVNEVLVRVISMIAFLLEFRLLQLTWSSRGDNDDSTLKTTLQESDKKAIYYTLPLYIVGALIAWLVQRLRGPPKTIFRHYKVNLNPSLTFWGDIKSYAGFILDTFLVPQIMFNVFSDSKETALSIPFYLGITIVRLLPHGYDLLRAHSNSWRFDLWYIYADPGMNFYTTAWDIIISWLGVAFIVVIFIQQRFGGRWVVPRKFNSVVAYEMVPLESS